MAITKKISEMTPAGTLTGTELIEIVQGGNTRRSTIQGIIDLVPSAPTSALSLPLTNFNETDVNHGYHPTKLGMVISQGGGGSWKEGRVESPNVFWDPKIGKYRMVYVGYTGIPSAVVHAQIGYATSDDLLTWTEFGSNPFFSYTGVGGDPDQNGVTGPFVWMENGTYYLFYIGLTATGLEQGTKSICLATSTDFVTWTRHGAVITVGTNGTWRDVAVWHPCVVKRGDTYYLFFNASDGGNGGLHESIGYATSTDLLTWTVDDTNSPVLDVGTSGQWDDERVGDPFLWKIRDTWYMSYYGHQTSGDHTQEGYATCPDSTFPLGWTKYASNPVLAVGSPGSFDDKDAGRTCHMIVNNRHFMWYTTDDGSFGIGIAAAVDAGIQGTPPFVGARAYNDAAQSIPNNASTAVTFNQEEFDTDGIHSTSVNTALFTVPVDKPGKWRFGYKVAFSANATGSRFAFMRKNNDGTDATNVRGSTAVGIPNGTEVAGVFGGCIVNLAVGDNVQLIVYQNSGGNLNIGSGSDAGLMTAMECQYLGS